MEPQKQLGEAVVKAVQSGKATSSTSITLRTLLNPGYKVEKAGESHSTRDNSRNKSSKTPHRAATTTRGSAKNTAREQAFNIHDDASTTLSAKAKQALATSIVNAGLKFLSQAVRVQFKTKQTSQILPINETPQKPAVTDRPSQYSPTRNGALQPRSGNSTPTPHSQKAVTIPRKPPPTSPCASSDGTGEKSARTEAVAECISLAFHYLLSIDPDRDNTDAAKDWQLEKGMLALCNKLVDLKLDQLAMKELRTVKRRLESHMSPMKDEKVATIPARVSSTTSQKVALSNLLELNLSDQASLNVLSLSATYQMSVLKCISNQRKPATLTSALQYLEITNVGGPVNIIQQYASHSGDNAKAAQQLCVLSQLILSLCPNASSSKDEAALDTTRYPSPQVVFRLQSMALQIQGIANELASQQSSSSYSPAGLFSKLSTVYLRRSRMSRQQSDAYKDVVAAYRELRLSEAGISASNGDNLALFKIHRNLSLLAEDANLHNEAMNWADNLAKDGENLEESHALRSAARVRRLTTWLNQESDDNFRNTLNDECTELRRSLESPLTGVTSDLEVLLIELSLFINHLIRHNKSGRITSSQTELFGVAAGFVARHNRLHPGIGGRRAIDVVDSAVSASRSTEELSSWVTKDAIQVMYDPGSVHEILQLASTNTLSQTWSSSRIALVLSRMLKSLMYTAVRSDPDTCTRLIFDDNSLQLEQRGALLEWQFLQASSYCRKKQYQPSGQRLLPELLNRMNECYSPSDHPLRRARVAMLVLRKAQEDPESIPPSVLTIWQDCQLVARDRLVKDHGLSHFVVDINSALQVAKAFVDGCPEPGSLLPLLASWMDVLQSPNDEDITEVINDPTDLIAQLKGLDDYFAMFGYQHERLRLTHVLLRIYNLSGEDLLERIGTMLTQTRIYLEIGQTENARRTLLQVEAHLNSGTESKLKSLQYQACRSEYLLAIDDVVECQGAIGVAKSICEEIQKRDAATALSRRFQLLTSRIALVQSKLQLATGSSYEALKSAKGVTKHLNAIWLGSERSNKHGKHQLEESEDEDGESGINGIAKGISKLNLKSKSGIEEDASTESKIKGVAFWPLIPILCEALSHLSKVLAHHGIFRDAIYCSNQAVKVADTRHFSRLFPQMLIRRSILNTAAGKLEAAELDLTAAAERISPDLSLLRVDLIRAQAGLRLKEGLPDEALDMYDEAEHMLQKLQLELIPLHSEQSGAGKDTNPSDGSNIKARAQRSVSSRNKSGSKAVVLKPSASRSGSKNSPTTTAIEGAQKGQISCSYFLRKLEAHILLDKTLTAFKMGAQVAAYIVQLQSLFGSLPGTSAQRQAEFHGMMRKVATALQQDVSFSVLPESTLAIPALINPATEISETIPIKPSTSLKSQRRPARTAIATSKKTKAIPAETLESLLSDAAGCLTIDGSCIRTTAETHLEMAMVSSAAMLLSATCSSSESSLRLPVDGALAIEMARVNATECRSASAKVEIELHGSKRPQDWAVVTEPKIYPALTTSSFQEQYIDILPEPWTVISLSLSGDTEDLYLSRYRQGGPPLILRLPFARHKPDVDDDEPFDFNMGKGELQDIIELNNYTCHQPVDTKNKTARDKWWTEREALDRRLEELLINMENIWLGGFKGILSQKRSDPGLLDQFRTAFESTLERHLPSRNGAKRSSNRLVISDAILELFTGLEVNNDGEMDMDEALADLLYFVVDMLQFNGERNAYDEVDFDTMSVEIFDALNAYHRGTEDQDNSRKHTVLVLDRRLQAFPWESLPCLNDMSVSRVDSMLTLRERILEMQDQHRQNRSGRELFDGSYSVPANRGSYILNPSGDLKHTEESLGPVLATLTDTKDTCWSSIVKRGPTEDELKAMLDTSSTLLYFGHGAATQYVRPRAIRQLERCSEVVWLMGCSSGSVTEHDELEPSAVPYEYMVAGQARETSARQHLSPVSERAGSRKCMAVLAMLWDVTDKDIDRFSLAVGDEWGLWKSSPSQSKLPTKTPRKREVVDVPSTPRQCPKTPKTPRVRNTPAPTRTPARSRSRVGKERKQKSSLADAVARSRDVCYLRYLNGAAPVVYGIPVYLED